MTLAQLFLQAEAAYSCVSELGELVSKIVLFEADFETKCSFKSSTLNQFFAFSLLFLIGPCAVS